MQALSHAMQEEEAPLTAAERLTPQQRIALRLYAIGATREAIAGEVGVHQVTLTNWLKLEAGKEYLKEIELELDQDFRRLYTKVINVIDAGLQSTDGSLALASANIFLKAHGKFVQRTEHRDLTAEDVIKKIMTGELQPRKREPITIEGVVVSDVASLNAPEEKDKA